MNWKTLVRTIPDFPKPGIRFRDITPLLANAAAMRHLTAALVEGYHGAIDTVAGIEARGFIFGALAAQALGVGFVPIRKPGKLPSASIGHDYALEYGTNRIEMHADALAHGERVLLVDDLLATGGTAAAAASLVEQLGAHVVACAFAIELIGLPGRAVLEQRGAQVRTLCTFGEDE